MTKLPLSVFIIAKNEADRIGKAIQSVKGWVDEVIVIDSGSTDNTVELSKSLGADKVVFHEWEGYGQQKVYGESLCKNNWILNLDADEEATPELSEEIKRLFASGEPSQKIFRITYQNIFMHHDKPNPLGHRDSFVRLYDRRYAGFKASSVHDSVVSKGDILKEGRLENIVLHRCFRSLSHMLEKINYYTSMQAEDLIKRGKNPPAIRIFFEPILAFLKVYFWKRYFVYGIDGFVHSIIHATARIVRLAKAREIYKLKKNN